MNAFEIAIGRMVEDEPDDAHRVSIAVGGAPLIRALREGATEVDDSALVPPERLAFWLADNWWRLCWEPVPAAGLTSDWRMAHELAAIGGGFVWPRLTIWSEGDRIGLLTRADPVGVVGPVRYLGVDPPLRYIKGDDFQVGVDRFLDAVADEHAGFGDDRSALKSLIDALRSERANGEVAAWRRMEARLGYDPDEAPDATMAQLVRLAASYGAGAVEEAAAATPGPDAGATLDREIAAAEASRIVCAFDEAARLARPAAAHWRGTPWMKAERAAARLRQRFGVAAGPLSNKTLATLLGTRTSSLSASSDSDRLPYGLRLATGRGGKTKVAVRPRHTRDRRFDLSRSLGDAIWAGADRMGPIAMSRTDRQKFQRAFAQTLLCPYDDLVSFLDSDTPTDGELSDAAQYFHVSERVVRTVLVNKRGIERSRLLPASWQDADRLDEILEAA